MSFNDYRAITANIDCQLQARKSAIFKVRNISDIKLDELEEIIAEYNEDEIQNFFEDILTITSIYSSVAKYTDYVNKNHKIYSDVAKLAADFHKKLDIFSYYAQEIFSVYKFTDIAPVIPVSPAILGDSSAAID